MSWPLEPIRPTRTRLFSVTEWVFKHRGEVLVLTIMVATTRRWASWTDKAGWTAKQTGPVVVAFKLTA